MEIIYNDFTYSNSLKKESLYSEVQGRRKMVWGTTIMEKAVDG